MGSEWNHSGILFDSLMEIELWSMLEVRCISFEEVFNRLFLKRCKNIYKKVGNLNKMMYLCIVFKGK